MAETNNPASKTQLSRALRVSPSPADKRSSLARIITAKSYCSAAPSKISMIVAPGWFRLSSVHSFGAQKSACASSSRNISARTRVRLLEAMKILDLVIANVLSSSAHQLSWDVAADAAVLQTHRCLCAPLFFNNRTASVKKVVKQIVEAL